MSPWLLAAVIILFFEGAIIAIAPEKWQQTMRQITQLPPAVLRKVACILVACAFLLLFLLRWMQS